LRARREAPLPEETCWGRGIRMGERAEMGEMGGGERGGKTNPCPGAAPGVSFH